MSYVRVPQLKQDTLPSSRKKMTFKTTDCSKTTELDIIVQIGAPVIGSVPIEGFCHAVGLLGRMCVTESQSPTSTTIHFTSDQDVQYCLAAPRAQKGDAYYFCTLKVDCELTQI